MAKRLKRLRRYASRRRALKPGLSPGTLIIDPNAPRPQIKLTAYDSESLVERDIEDLDEISAALSTYRVVWVNVVGLGDAGIIEKIGKVFGLHRLALEDVVNIDQRPKVEHYGDYLFMVARMPTLEERLSTEQVSLFLGAKFVLTFDEHPGDCLNPVRERLRNKRGKIRDSGADYLAYALLDAIIDAYFPIIETYGERLELLEDAAVRGTSRDTPSRLLMVRHDLLLFRRAAWPLRDMLSSLYRDETPLMSADTRVYIRDCYDHSIQLIDVIETYREVTSGLMDLYMSGMSNRMNEVMKVLTMMATVFIPLTFIAGIYGMNFNTRSSPWNMPELEWYWGYPACLLLMMVTAALLVYYFYRKGWLAREVQSLADAVTKVEKNGGKAPKANEPGAPR
ncbi:MAG TPA: magnesium/cobalt transporter CorA [Polyangiaceae bacterium]|nr:magnesium/cobalt transporter CorA [Polyangiaceae bacterium]